MQIHVRKEYGTHGPYSLDQLQDLIDNGKFAYDDIAWVEGTPEWVPLNQIEGIYARPAPAPGSEPIEEGLQIRPWVRYWARSLDGLVIGLIVAVPFGFVMPDELNNRFVDQLVQAFALLVWVPIEAFMLSSFAYTPGKALLRVRVTNKDGTNLSFEQALSRGFSVWLKGMGIGLIPIVTLIMNYRGYRALSDRGVTDWDREGRFKVTHRTVGPIRVLLTILILVGFVALAILGTVASRMTQ